MRAERSHRQRDGKRPRQREDNTCWRQQAVRTSVEPAWRDVCRYHSASLKGSIKCCKLGFRQDRDLRASRSFRFRATINAVNPFLCGSKTWQNRSRNPLDVQKTE
ncbi:hypothetical protein AMAG_19063 [Allomyces macrogynus ATCC 38327]|uniref:Uncharacterized protein n=1 Tax=Allomyces macrogynus (strain ATCC 38327) TaxID=578462 RepID=A0A0L0SMT2_ALLM3|nr:hypothetical protein AMAG_19063 [Allomyces macrogynus ATCC 38327]|eukprot:KNE63793.1 hypothetical protein AMAG_19063 [Allomyces macrogynus ATCC 38327]